MPKACLTRLVAALWLLSLSASVLAQESAPRVNPPNDRSPRPTTQSALQSLSQTGLLPLTEETMDTRPTEGLMPKDMSQGLFDRVEERSTIFRGEDFSYTTFHWTASDLRHRPLYFEDAMLERHGQSCHPVVQPFASGARFFLTFPVLPYTMTVNPPRPAVSTLGSFRPGSAAPMLRQRPPLQLDAGVVEAAAWVGLIFLIP